jgi:hypothetical protein
MGPRGTCRYFGPNYTSNVDREVSGPTSILHVSADVDGCESDADVCESDAWLKQCGVPRPLKCTEHLGMWAIAAKQRWCVGDCKGPSTRKLTKPK